MIYIIILLLLVFTIEILVVRKGLKAARKNSGHLAGEQRSSMTASQANPRVQQATADQFHGASDDVREVSSSLPSDDYKNIVQFPGDRSKDDSPDLEHELRSSIPQTPREKSMMEMIQEIRGAAPSQERQPEPPLLQSPPGSSDEFEQAVDYEYTEEREEIIEETEIEYDEVDEYPIDSHDGMLDYSVREIVGEQKSVEEDDATRETEAVVSSEGLLKSGIRFVKEGKLDEGIAALEQAVEMTPDKAEAHFNLGIAYTLKEFTPRAINAYQKAIEIDPRYGKALFNLGTLYLKQGKLDQAIENLEQAVKCLADPMKALWNLYEAYRCRERFSKALSTLQQLIDLEPDDASLHNHLGICYVKLGNYKKAIASWNRSISLGASSLLIFYNLGKTYELCGDEVAAIEQYERFLHLNTKKSDWKELVDEVEERLQHLQQGSGDKHS